MQAYLCLKPNLPLERQSFGALTTIDDGILKPIIKGFVFHLHNDVEVVTFMVEGEVRHIDPNDSYHNGTLKANGIQIITAVSDIVHNEENNSDTEIMHASQIWLISREKNMTPNFSSKHLPSEYYNNDLVCILSGWNK